MHDISELEHEPVTRKGRMPFLNLCHHAANGALRKGTAAPELGADIVGYETFGSRYEEEILARPSPSG